MLNLVLDTNVVVAALWSSRGASFRLLSRVGISEGFQIHLSVPLVLEYEDVLLRSPENHGLSAADIGSVIDYLCRAGTANRIHYLWRPFLKDPKDDMVLELAVASSCDVIVTFNQRDFASVPEAFGIRVLSPRELLVEFGGSL